MATVYARYPLANIAIYNGGTLAHCGVCAARGRCPNAKAMGIG